MSAIGPGCVKTCATGECAYLFSPLSPFDCDCQRRSFPIQRNRDNISTCTFDVGVFTQPGPRSGHSRRTAIDSLLSDREMRRANLFVNVMSEYALALAAMTNELEGGSQCLTLEAAFAAQ